MVTFSKSCQKLNFRNFGARVELTESSNRLLQLLFEENFCKTSAFFFFLVNFDVKLHENSDVKSTISI